jgi:hypothetical protein
MAEIGARLQRAIEELTGNEALLGMLETEAAEEMLNWGISMVTSLTEQSAGMDDSDAETLLMPRLKAVRQWMRTVGNWAAGQYEDPASRVQLGEKLLQYFATIRGRDAILPTVEELDAVLSEVDERENTPLQLILNLRILFQKSM